MHGFEIDLPVEHLFGEVLGDKGGVVGPEGCHVLPLRALAVQVTLLEGLRACVCECVRERVMHEWGRRIKTIRQKEEGHVMRFRQSCGRSRW